MNCRECADLNSEPPKHKASMPTPAPKHSIPFRNNCEREEMGRAYFKVYLVIHWMA
jgi:hypothetical protein